MPGPIKPDPRVCCSDCDGKGQLREVGSDKPLHCYNCSGRGWVYTKEFINAQQEPKHGT